LQIRLFFDVPCELLARFLVYGFGTNLFKDVDVVDLFTRWEESKFDFQTCLRDRNISGDFFGKPELMNRTLFPNWPGPKKKSKTRVKRWKWYTNLIDRN
jgi:hypothetical protein